MPRNYWKLRRFPLHQTTNRTLSTHSSSRKPTSLSRKLTSTRQQLTVFPSRALSREPFSNSKTWTWLALRWTPLDLSPTVLEEALLLLIRTLAWFPRTRLREATTTQFWGSSSSRDSNKTRANSVRVSTKNSFWWVMALQNLPKWTSSSTLPNSWIIRHLSQLTSTTTLPLWQLTKTRTRRLFLSLNWMPKCWTNQWRMSSRRWRTVA